MSAEPARGEGAGRDAAADELPGDDRVAEGRTREVRPGGTNGV